jgi:hypothetical protein
MRSAAQRYQGLQETRALHGKGDPGPSAGVGLGLDRTDAGCRARLAVCCLTACSLRLAAAAIRLRLRLLQYFSLYGLQLQQSKQLQQCRLVASRTRPYLLACQQRGPCWPPCPRTTPEPARGGLWCTGAGVLLLYGCQGTGRGRWQQLRQTVRCGPCRLRPLPLPGLLTAWDGRTGRRDRALPRKLPWSCNSAVL